MNFLRRIWRLLTRRYTWVAQDGTAETIKESGRTAWAIDGFHPDKWWWVRRWGTKDCGCMFNPITRKRVLYCFDEVLTTLGWTREDLGFEW